MEVKKKDPSPPRRLYDTVSLIKEYPHQYGKEYEVDFVRDPKPKFTIADPKVLPTGKDDGKGPGRILGVYVDHVLNQSQLKHKTQDIRLNHFTKHFQNMNFDQQLHSRELNNLPYASSIAKQKGINKPNIDSDTKRFFIHFTNRLKKDDGFLIYARLQNMCIDDMIVKNLAGGLSRNTRLKILMLHNNYITDQGVELLCTALRFHPTIHTIWLGSNRITDIGIRHVSHLLSQNTNIKELNLSNKFNRNKYSEQEEELHPYLTYISADYLSNHIKQGALITNLSISHQKLYDDGAIILFNALPSSQIRSLTLINNFITNKACLILQSILIQNPILEQLVLSKNQISDAGAIAIAYGLAYNELVTLMDLSENEIGEKGLFSLFQTVQNHNKTIKSLVTVNNKSNDNRAELLAATRNASVFALGIRQSVDIVNGSFQAGNRERAKSIKPNPSFQEIRRSLFLQNPQATDKDHGILKEIVKINSRMNSVDESEESLPSSPSKLLSKNLSRTFSFNMLVNINDSSASGGDLDGVEDNKSDVAHSMSPERRRGESRGKTVGFDEAEEEEVDYRHHRQPAKSFVDLLQSPFQKNKAIQNSRHPSISKPVAVPGVSVHGRKPTNSIYEELGVDNPNNQRAVSIQEAIATAVSIVEALDKEEVDEKESVKSDTDDQKSVSSSGSRKISRNSSQKKVRVTSFVTPSGGLNRKGSVNASNLIEKEPEEAKVEIKKRKRLSKDLGKTLGVPNIQSIGIKPIRTNVSSVHDSAQHFMYLRVATDDDPIDARPTSLIKIGLDRIAERKRVMEERQNPVYKEQKVLRMQERIHQVQQEAAISRVSDRFWKDWELRMRQRYPRGIDVAKGTTSTKLDQIVIPPPPKDPKEIDYYSKYDRSDPQNPWNRYLEFKHNEKYSYQRHLGFHKRKFPPGQVLAARKKENFLKRHAPKVEQSPSVSQQGSETVNTRNKDDTTSLVTNGTSVQSLDSVDLIADIQKTQKESNPSKSVKFDESSAMKSTSKSTATLPPIR